MTEAKGSDVQLTADEKEFYFVCSLNPIQERLVRYFVEARVQAAAVDMRERCAKIADITKVEGELDDGTVIWNMPPCCADSLGHAAGRIRALPISTDALDAMLLKARIEQARYWKFPDGEVKLQKAIWDSVSSALSPNCQILANSISDKLLINLRWLFTDNITDLERQLAALTQPAPEKEQP